jgi:predicted RNase H-like HicB family nuclease
MNFRIEFEQENDGRWIAEVGDIPGVLVYGKTRDEAMLKAQALALRVLAERIDLGEVSSLPLTISFLAA